MEILMNIINSEIGIIFTKIFDRHPENPIIFVWPITLFFELGSPFITFIRPGSRPFIWSPRISELDNSFILSLFVYNSLSIQNSVSMAANNTGILFDFSSFLISVTSSWANKFVYIILVLQKLPDIFRTFLLIRLIFIWCAC